MRFRNKPPFCKGSDVVWDDSRLQRDQIDVSHNFCFILGHIIDKYGLFVIRFKCLRRPIHPFFSWEKKKNKASCSFIHFLQSGAVLFLEPNQKTKIHDFLAPRNRDSEVKPFNSDASSKLVWRKLAVKFLIVSLKGPYYKRARTIYTL